MQRRVDVELPFVPQSVTIPKLVHQTYKTRKLPHEIAKSIDVLRENNPEYEWSLYDDQHMIEFIANNYSKLVLSHFLSIAPEYGAARADLFRYLIMYMKGGVYLDIKSTALRPLAEIILPNDKFILSHWSNRVGEPFEGWGRNATFPNLPEGEFQQWHIIAVAGHPFLKAVIQRTLENIANYSPWRQGVGMLATILTTGPVCYTEAIIPLLDAHSHRKVRTEREIGLCYSIYGDRYRHRTISDNYYRNNRSPLVRRQGSLADGCYRLYALGARISARAARWFKSV